MLVSRPAFLLWLLVAALAGLWLIPAATAWHLAPDLGHAWAVPVLMAYLWWERWGERPMLDDRAGTARRARVVLLTTLGALGLLELPLRLLLTPFPLWPMLLATFTLLFAGVALAGAGLLGGAAAVRWVGGPLILLLSALPIPSLAETEFILPLRGIMASLTAEISNLLGYPALAMGTSLRLGHGWVGVDEACGGIRSLQACVMIGLFFGEWYRFRWGRRLVLLLAAIGCALLGNFARVLTLSLLAHSGLDTLEQAHDPAGWIAMGFSLVLTGWLACRWAGYRWPERKPPAAPAPASVSAPFRAVYFVSAIVGLLTLNELATRIWFHQGEQRRAVVPRWTAQFPVGDQSYQPQPLAQTARAILQPDHYLAGRWRVAEGIYASAYYIEWRHGQLARSIPFLHNPTVCLPYAGCELLETLPLLQVPTQSGTVPFHAYRFRQFGQDILVAFTIWDTSGGQPLRSTFATNSWAEWWHLQWKEVQEAHEHQPAQLLSITIPFAKGAEQMASRQLSSIIAPTD